MPSLPQHSTFLSPDGQTVPALYTWGDGLVAALRRTMTMVIHTLNALSITDTLANRTATPLQNHIFFTASDTNQLFCGVAGAWQNAGPRRGTATVAEAATTATVTLSPVENATTYVLGLTSGYDAGRVWWTSKAVGSFVINVSTAGPVGGGSVDWTLWRA